MSGRYIGGLVHKVRSSFATQGGLRKSLSCVGGSNYIAVPKSHHEHSVLKETERSSINGIRSYLFNSNCVSVPQGIRHYSSKIQSTPSPKTLLTGLCENEINDFKTLIPEQDDVQAFLDESGFKLTTIKENLSENVLLTKSYADGTEIVVKFDSMESQDQLPEDFDNFENFNENQEENQEEQEEQEEEQENQEENQENQEESTPHDHPFEIQIRSTKASKNSLTFGGFASQDGNYTISAFYKGGFNDIVNPVDISGTSSEFQDNILLLLQQYGINEKLSFFIHDYVHAKKLNDYINSFQSLKDFVSRD